LFNLLFFRIPAVNQPVHQVAYPQRKQQGSNAAQGKHEKEYAGGLWLFHQHFSQ
jgi:hypothetical protein